MWNQRQRHGRTWTQSVAVVFKNGLRSSGAMLVNQSISCTETYWDTMQLCMIRSISWLLHRSMTIEWLERYSVDANVAETHSIIWQLFGFLHFWTSKKTGMPVQFAANQGPSQAGLFKNPRTFLIVFSGFRLIGYDLIRVSHGGHYTWNSPEPVKKTNYITLYNYI